MKAYNTIIQKLLNRSNRIYSVNNLPFSAVTMNSVVTLRNLEVTDVLHNTMFTEAIVSPIVYANYLTHQLWAMLYTNGELTNPDNLIMQDRALIQVKHIFYLYIFNPTHNIGLLNNATNFIINKYRFLKDALSNPFYNELIKNSVISSFSKIQNTYFALVKFSKICKHRICSVYNTTDILMNAIVRGRNNVIEILQNNKIYLFTRPDIINIMNAALSHSPNFFCEPLPIKNPYNNIVFRKSDLYNFYFFLRSGMYIVTDLIQNFFLSNFNIYLFQKNNEYVIREYYIKNYVETTPPDSLCLDIKYMLHTLNISKKIYIHSEFPKNTLVQIMQPYLLLYYQSIYSIDLYKRNVCTHDLLTSLVKFINYNPQFGRKIIKLEPQFRVNESCLKFKKFKQYLKKTVTFNMRHLPFYSKDSNFMINQIFEPVDSSYDNDALSNDDDSFNSSNESSIIV